MTNRTDNFNRADNSSSLGTPSDGGSAWVAHSGVWGIVNNKAFLSNGATQAIASLSSGTSDVDIQISLSNLTGGQDIGLVGRVADDNNYILGAIGASDWKIYKKVSGSYTQVGSTVSGTPVNGDVVVLSLSGTSVALKVNGVTKVSGTVSELSTNTRHGIRSNGYTPESFDDFSITDTGGGGSASTAIAATLANITGSVASKSNPKTAISATLANITASVGSTVGTLTTTITATLGNVTGAIASVGSTTNGTFASEVLKDYAGNVLASTALSFVRFYNDTTGALVLSKTGVSTNGSGIVTFSDAALVAGTTYRVDWETAAGSRRMPRKAAA